MLQETKKDILIDISISKEPYIKNITNDKIINLTGEAGSGKSYFSKKYNSKEYIVIDIDLIFKDKPTDNKEILKIKEYFKKKYGKNILDICEDFDEIYKDILDYFKDTEKTLVINSAQYRNLKDLSLLKGQIIIMRTCVDTCYKRCIEKWKNNHKRYNKEELEKYTNKKLKMYICYKNLNKFIERVNEL